MAAKSVMSLRERLVNWVRIGFNKPEPKFLPSPATPKLRFIQFRRKNDQRKRLGLVSEDGKKISELAINGCVSNDLLTFLQQNVCIEELQQKMKLLRVENIVDVKSLLAPINNPSKIICAGLNYKDYCADEKLPVPEAPVFFSKLQSSLVGPTCNIVLPPVSRQVDWEVELAVVIGKRAKCVDRDCAMDHVFGYTIAQDISARDWQPRNGHQVLLAKSMDTFCPLGPAVVHKSLIKDVHNLTIKTKVNGVEKQNGNTGNMIFKIDDLISRVSQFMTLLPGDIILTGTPAGVGMNRNPPEYLKPGDVVESEIQYLGKMRNHVVAAKLPV